MTAFVSPGALRRDLAHEQGTAAERPRRRAPSWASAVFLALAIGAFFASTRREGIPLGSDAMLYISQARNIAEGAPTGTTGYIVNQTRVRGYSPEAYPPVLPLALAPVYAASGLDVERLKLVPIAFFVGFLICAFGVFRSAVGPRAAIVLIGLLGLAPYCWELKDNVLAEFPLLFFCYASLLYYQRLQEREGAASLLSYVGLAWLLYLACATKFAAVMTLVPAVLGALLLRDRRPTARLFVTGVVLVVLLGLQIGWLASPREYSRTASLLSLRTVIGQSVGYWYALGRFWYQAAPAGVERLFVLALLALATAGWFGTLRLGIGATEIFAPLAAGVAIMFPARWGPNYLMPFIPLVPFYALAACARFPAATRRAAAALVLVPILGSLAIVHARASHEPLPSGLDRPEVLGMREALTRHVGRNGMVVAAYPRLLALLARTRATTYESTLGDHEQWAYFRSIGVTHVLLSGADARYFRPFVTRHQGRFRSIWRNAEYELLGVDEHAPDGALVEPVDR